MIELLANRLGSIITAISVSTGAVAAEYDYQAYGIRTESAVIDQPYGFTGREHDAESGLIYLRMRTYDPAARVFLQTDPIEFAGGYFNLFAYVGGDPTNGSDPSGMFESLSWRQMTWEALPLQVRLRGQLRTATVIAHSSDQSLAWSILFRLH